MLAFVLFVRIIMDLLMVRLLNKAQINRYTDHIMFELILSFVKVQTRYYPNVYNFLTNSKKRLALFPTI